MNNTAQMLAQGLVYGSTKCYPASVGLSCAFRQWRADSHCHFIHGYSFEVTATFETEELDERNWVVDFGSLKTFKGWLEDTFDHKTIIAEDDPELEYFIEGAKKGVLDLIKLPAGGCERFSEYLFGACEVWLKDNGYAPRVRLVKLEVREHAGNSAYVRRRD